MYTILCQHRLHWLRHVPRVEDGRFPKDILYGELSSGKGTTGRTILQLKDVVKRDMKAPRHKHAVLGRPCSQPIKVEGSSD